MLPAPHLAHLHHILPPVSIPTLTMHDIVQAASSTSVLGLMPNKGFSSFIFILSPPGSDHQSLHMKRHCFFVQVPNIRSFQHRECGAANVTVTLDFLLHLFTAKQADLGVVHAHGRALMYNDTALKKIVTHVQCTETFHSCLHWDKVDCIRKTRLSRQLEYFELLV
ncbi:hypothetical protein ARMGADRAFT_121588 [Armillaria gallica]|uniref:Uncharacterized protein n=1 Tax=Armillaria gallica TaxID=47427 RepID=A0A2H3DDN3_ARMGA|nr:hypothetical protein ARMGADRAFT_121588 [Armillaria gallica]